MRSWRRPPPIELAQAGAEVTRISLGDFPLPIYDGDLQTQIRRAEARGQSQAHDVGAIMAC